MTDLFSKFFLSKITATNAVTILLCVVVMLVTWPLLSHLAVERSIPEEYVFPLFGLFMLAFSYLSIRCIVFISKKAHRLFGKLQERSQDELRRKSFEEK